MMEDTDGRPLLSEKPKSSSNRFALIFACTTVVLLIAVIVLAATGDFASDSSSSSLSTTSCNSLQVQGVKNGVVSTTHFLATQAGMEILEQGGNAVDAAAAVQFALAVVQPTSTGIGGGLLALYYKASTGEVIAIDGREEAPARFNETSFCMNATCLYDANCGCDDGPWPFTDRRTGGHPAGVPGVVHATARLLKDHGTMTLAQVLAPAIRIARDGFQMYDLLYNGLMSSQTRITQFNATRQLFYPLPGDMPLPLGEIFKNPDLADTLELIASNGSEVFYTGIIGQEIVNAVKTNINNVTNLPGVMELPDIQGYTSVYRTPVNTTYRNYTVYGMNLPSSGGPSLMMNLNILELLDLNDYELLEGEYLSRILDSQDIVFSDRGKYMADADFITDVPLAGLLNKTYIQQRAQSLMAALKAAKVPYNGTIPAGNPPGSSQFQYAYHPNIDEKGTTHFSVVDKQGNVISFTTTIESSLGCGVVVPGRGFLLNNELTDFTGVPSDSTGAKYANRPQGGKMPRSTAIGSDSTTMGGKRPMSSMTPTLIFRDGKPVYGLGSPGGATIIGTVLNGVLNILDFNLCLGDAIAQPRGISQNQPNALLEPALQTNTKTFNLLQQRGYAPTNATGYYGVIQAVEIRYGGKNGDEMSFNGAADITRMSTASVDGF